MGCSASRLEDEEAVRLCRDRKNFIKQAVEQRIRFASNHISYLQSLKRVSMALNKFVECDDDHHDFLFLDSYITPVKRLSHDIDKIPSNLSEKRNFHISKYLKSSANSSVSVEERPPPTETIRINSYYPTGNYYGTDGFLGSPMNNSSSFFTMDYDDRARYPPPSPQDSQWDFFWNPFSSIENQGYPILSSYERALDDDDLARLRQVREEEGIPELEEEVTDEEQEAEEQQEEQQEEEFVEIDVKNDKLKFEANENPSEDKFHANNTKQVVKEFRSRGVQSVEVSKESEGVEVNIKKEKDVVVSRGGGEETPGFTVYLNRRPTSIKEVVKRIEEQFMRICDAAHEVSVMLEASRAQYSSNSSELAGIFMDFDARNQTNFVIFRTNCSIWFQLFSCCKFIYYADC